MRRTRLVLASAAALLAAIVVAGSPAAADSHRDIIQDLDEDATDSAAIARRLEKVTSILAKADARLDSIVASVPDVLLPPDPCAGSTLIDAYPPDPCRQVVALQTIDADADGLLGSVEVLDDGTDAGALTRRLDRATTTIGGASTRLASLAASWISPPDPESPPDPCTPAIAGALDQLAGSAESASHDAGDLDTCSAPASLTRRLGHVAGSLDTASARLDGIATSALMERRRPAGRATIFVNGGFLAR